MYMAFSKTPVFSTKQSVTAYAEEDGKRRAAFARRVPPEPSEGAAGSTKLCVHLGETAHWRRFDHDVTLEDVCNYVRSLEGCPAVQAPNELRLAEVTISPLAIISTTQCGVAYRSQAVCVCTPLGLCSVVAKQFHRA